MNTPRPIDHRPLTIDHREKCAPAARGGHDLPPPKGISVPAAAHALQLSVATVRRMIAAGQLVAWKPRGSAGRKWLVDEVSLAATQSAMIQHARQACAPAQAAMVQGWLEL